MNEPQPSVSVLEPPSPTAPPAGLSPAGPRSGTRFWRLLGQGVPTVLALGLLAGLVFLGRHTGWRLPRFSVLLGREQAKKDPWCVEHSVPDSVCVECREECRPRGQENGWCRAHGVHECPLEHPEVAQLVPAPVVGKDDGDRAARALAFAPRVENEKKCKRHQRRLQFTSTEAVTRLGIEVAPVTRALVREAIVANGEIVYDPTRVARLSTQVPGTIWRVEKQVGDRVRRGEVLAVVDSAEVGRAKAEFLQALTQVELKAQTVARMKELAGDAVSVQSVQEAEAALEEARVRVLTAEQALLNLGLPIRATYCADLRPEEVAGRLRLLGLPEVYARSLDTHTASSNLLAVTSPLDGEVIERWVVAGEQAEPAKAMFVVADTRQMWLRLNVRFEDAPLLKPGLKVQFRHGDHKGGDTGTVAWVSPGAEERTRTVPVRIELPNPDGRHHAQTFGSARVILREEPSAIVVPSNAVHWEGDCNIVFVRDRHFNEPGTPKVFHVRKVRPGAKDGPNTEIIAGVLPGELVATTGSGTLRSELLKNNLGAG